MINYSSKINLGKKIWWWFFNNVYLFENEVIKVPRPTSYIVAQTFKKLQYALEAHQDYLGSFVPETEIVKSRLSPLGYIMVQPYFPNIGPVSFDTWCHISLYEDELIELLWTWLEMQSKERILFDIFGFGGYKKSLLWKRVVFENILQWDELQQSKLQFVDIGYIPFTSLNPQWLLWAKLVNPYLLEKVGLWSNGI